MTSTIANITFDCAEPIPLANFWSTVLDRPLDEGASPFFASIGRTDGVSPNWFFIKVGEAATAKNRCHIDLETADPATEVDRLCAAGATKIADKAEHGHEWTVMNDPEGNVFCVSGPH